MEKESVFALVELKAGGGKGGEARKKRRKTRENDRGVSRLHMTWTRLEPKNRPQKWKKSELSCCRKTQGK